MRTNAVLIPTFELHQSDLTRLVKRHFRFNFDFQGATGAPDDVLMEYDVNGWLPESSTAWKAQADEIRSGERSRNVSLILNVLALDGHMPFGKYLISTFQDLPVERHRKRLINRFGRESNIVRRFENAKNV